MKVFDITAKNLKVLMRSKTSMFVIIFAPLIIMLLVGFAFNNPVASKINIGYVASEKTNLTNSFIEALRTNPNFLLVEYFDKDICKNMIEQAKVHMCIIFPTDFVLKNDKTNDIVFFVDQSRANFVYAVIDTVSSRITFTSDKLSFQLTADLLSAISTSKQSNDDNVVKIITLKSSANDLSAKLKVMQSKLETLDLSRGNVDTESSTAASGIVKSDVTDLSNKAQGVIDSGKQLVSDLSVSGRTASNGSSYVSAFGSNLNSYQTEITDASNKTTLDIDNLNKLIDAINTDVDNINLRLDTARTATVDSSKDLDTAQTALKDLNDKLDVIKSNIERVNSQISGLKVTSAENIVNPIKTTILPITTKATNLNFIFPYLVILIIVFVSIMLSSTIIIMEKTSKAYFRNFTTPTKDFTFIISVFLTSLFVVVLQLVLILILAYYFLNTTILTNVALTLLMVFLAITLFTLIGMIIGYLFNSQEAVTMAAIAIGSVFLFLSNLILPLETMSSVIQQIARYNPYVVASELLKKLTLFGSLWKDVYADFILVFIYVAVAFILTVIIQKMSKIQYISRRPIVKQLGRKDEIIDKFFRLKSGVLLRNEKELLDELKKISDITFQDYVTAKKNDFESWLLMNKQHELAKIVGKARTRKEMIDLLEKYRNDLTAATKEIDVLKKP